MSGERIIDPTTGDYLLSDGSDFDRADDLGNEIYKRLFQVEGTAPLEPTVGRPLRERLKDIPRVHRMLIQDAERALQPMVDEGRAASISVSQDETILKRPGRLNLAIVAVDAGGRAQTYKTWIKVS